MNDTHPDVAIALTSIPSSSPSPGVPSSAALYDPSIPSPSAQLQTITIHYDNEPFDRLVWWKKGNSKKLIILMLVQFAFVCAELVIAVSVNSLTLLSDALHNLGDAFTLFLALLVQKYSVKDATNQHTFGWVRGRIIGALASSTFLLGIFFLIFIESIQRFIAPEPIENPMMVVWTALGAFGVNLLGALLFCGDESGHGHSHGGDAHGHSHAAPAPAAQSTNAHGHQHGQKDLNIRAVFLHFLGDAFASLGAVFSGLLFEFVSSSSKYYADPAIAMLVILFVVASSIGIIRESMGILMQWVPRSIELSQLKTELCQISGVLSVHELHVWALTENKTVASVHVLCEQGSDVQAIVRAMKSVFHKYSIHSSTIQPEFSSPSSPSSSDDESKRAAICESFCEPDCDPANACCPTSPLLTHSVLTHRHGH